ncbi:DMT family transporter [bacterium]|nr:DMT family transporter [bacterium]
MKDLPVKHKMSSVVLAYISISIAVILYGTSLTATKICLNEYSTLSLMALRMSLSAILFIPFFLTIYKNVRIDKSDLKYLLLMVLCEPCLYFLFETNALKFTSSGQAGVVSSLEPVLIILFARMILKERFPRLAYIGLAVAILGSILLSLTSDVNELAPRPLLGNILQLGAEILTCISVVTTKYLMDKYPPFYLAGIAVLGGALFFVSMCFINGEPIHLITSSSSMFIVGYLGILTVVAYALYNSSMKILSASKVSPFLFLLPISALFFGWFILGETSNILQMISCFVIFFGVYLCQSFSKYVEKKERIKYLIDNLEFTDTAETQVFEKPMTKQY